MQSLPSTDVVFIKLARTVYEAARTQSIRFQGALVTGGVDEDAMQYWVSKPGYRIPACTPTSLQTCGCSNDRMCSGLEGVSLQIRDSASEKLDLQSSGLGCASQRLHTELQSYFHVIRKQKTQTLKHDSDHCWISAGGQHVQARQSLLLLKLLLQCRLPCLASGAQNKQKST